MTTKNIWMILMIALLLPLASCEKAEQSASSTAVEISGKDYLYVPVSNALHIIDVETDTILKTIPYDAYIVGSTFSPDKKRYYLNTFKSVLVIDTASQELVDTLKFSSARSKTTILGLAISNDNSKLYLACSIVKKKENIPRLNLLPPQLIVFDLKTKQVVKSFEVPQMTKSILPVSNDPDHLMLTGYDLHKLNLKTGKIEVLYAMANVPEGTDPRNFLPISDGGSPGDHGVTVYMYLAGEGLGLHVGYLLIDRNNATARIFKGDDLWFAYSTVLSIDQKHIFAVMDELVKVDVENGETVNWVQLETGTNYSIALSSDGKKVYVGPGGPDVSVYDAESLELLKVINLSADGVAMHRLTL